MPALTQDSPHQDNLLGLAHHHHAWFALVHPQKTLWLSAFLDDRVIVGLAILLDCLPINRKMT
jgi:hypothetical protein